jgi:nucleoside-diphosphate-sugar epimerase
MKVLLIGGTGFIGRHVVEQLAASGHEIVVLHRGKSKERIPNHVQRIIGDANHLEEHRQQLRKLAPDVVLNFILSSGRQAEEMMSALRGIAARVVAISSMDVYRACGVLHGTEFGELQRLPLTEESELRTQPAYSPVQMEAGKQIFSWMTTEYDKIPVERTVMSDPELPGTVLRLPMVYGPGDPLHRFYPVIKRMRDRQRKILLEAQYAKWRGPKGFVENVAEAITLAATWPIAKEKIYNVAEKEMNWDGEFVLLPKERLPAHLLNEGNWAQHWVASSQRIRQELEYEEKISRTEALQRTIEWELDHPPSEIPAAPFDYSAEDAASV